MPANIDIERIVEDWAWEYFRRKAGNERKMRKLLEKEYITMEIDWKRVNFVHGDPEFKPAPTKAGRGKPINNVLFETTFVNKTKHPQNYSFRTERCTKSACEIFVEEGYTQGAEMSVTLKTPCEIFEANAGYKREMSITKAEGQVIEEELTWEVDNQLQVEARHRAEAKLVILEEQYDGGFEILTKIKGRVRAIFTNIKDNNSFVKAVEGDIDEIVAQARDQGKVKGDTMTVERSSRTVLCRTKGVCKFKYGLKQNVEVDQFPLD